MMLLAAKLANYVYICRVIIITHIELEAKCRLYYLSLIEVCMMLSHPPKFCYHLPGNYEKMGKIFTEATEILCIRLP